MASTARRSKPWIVLSTVSSQKEAKTIAGTILRKRLAACVNIIPQTTSFFWWRGKIDQAREFLLIIKTEAHHLKHLEKTIQALHSYDIPEMIGFPAAWGHKPYLKWLLKSLS